MTKQEAVYYVTTHDDDDDVDDQELEEVFLALYDRPPDDQDRDDGLWSLICVLVA